MSSQGDPTVSAGPYLRVVRGEAGPEEIAARRGLPIEHVAPAAMLRARAAAATAPATAGAGAGSAETS